VRDETGIIISGRYTTCEMLEVESRMGEQAQEMADTRTRRVFRIRRQVR